VESVTYGQGRRTVGSNPPGNLSVKTILERTDHF
jgi:hypothetical protein